MIVDSVEEGSAYSAELSITPERRTSNWNEREVSVGYGNLSPGMKMAVKPSALTPYAFTKTSNPNHLYGRMSYMKNMPPGFQSKEGKINSLWEKVYGLK